MRRVRHPLRASLHASRTVFFALLCTACATSGSAGGVIRSSGIGADDRLVIRRHTDVMGVAASPRHVFALTTQGLVVYDRVFGRWRTPPARVDDDLRLAGVDQLRLPVLAADPIEDAVWIGVPGAVVLYRAAVEQVQRFTVTGLPDAIAFARGDASEAYVRASGQWLRVSRAGFVTPLSGGIGNVALVPPAGLEDVYRRHPALRGQLTFLLRDDRAPLRTMTQVLSGTLSPDRPSEAWIGTRGDGLWMVDASFMRAEPLRYGMLDDAVGALATGAGGVWSAGQGTTARGGLSFVDADLQRFSWHDGSGTTSLAGVRAFDLAVRGTSAWLATDRGVWRVRLGTTDAVTQWGRLHGLPDDLVQTVLPRDDGAWLGTARGLAFVHDTAAPASVRGDVRAAAFAGQPVHALALVRDTLLAGTNSGLFALAVRPVSDVVTDVVTHAAPRRVLPAMPALARPVRALAWSDSLLVVATDRMVHLLPVAAVLGGAREAVEPGTLRDTAGTRDSVDTALLPITETDLRAIGAVFTAAIDARSVWIAGRGGVLAWSRQGGTARVLRTGAELAGAPTALALDDTWAWVGTGQGLVRVRRARDGGLP